LDMLIAGTICASTTCARSPSISASHCFDLLPLRPDSPSYRVFSSPAARQTSLSFGWSVPFSLYEMEMMLPMS
jgi:hypothetical protein